MIDLVIEYIKHLQSHCDNNGDVTSSRDADSAFRTYALLTTEERRKEYEQGFNESIKKAIALIRNSDLELRMREKFTISLVNHLLRLLEESNELKDNIESSTGGQVRETSLQKRVTSRDFTTQTTSHEAVTKAVPPILSTPHNPATAPAPAVHASKTQ